MQQGQTENFQDGWKSYFHILVIFLIYIFWEPGIKVKQKYEICLIIASIILNRIRCKLCERWISVGQGAQRLHLGNKCKSFKIFKLEETKILLEWLDSLNTEIPVFF